MLITKRVEFSASHVCRNTELSGEENERIYGAAANPLGHGHNYVLDVTIEGQPDPISGMVVDLKAVKESLQALVLEPFDHRFLNHEVAPFQSVVPTVENIAVEIWKRLEKEFQTGSSRLHGVRLYETSDLYVEYFGGQ